MDKFCSDSKIWSWHKLNEFHIFAEKTYGAQAKHFMSALRQQKPSKEWAQN